MKTIERTDAEEFLQKKDVWNDPFISDRTDSNAYEVTDLMVEFANECVKDATRWISVEDELPDCNRALLVKTFTDIDDEYEMDIDELKVDSTGYSWFISNGDNVAFWRYIE